MTMRSGRLSLGVAMAIAGILATGWIAFAGDLEPPAPPAPTMKTLDQVEPRTPIHAADLPLTITESGSYYLAEDITAAGGGISIEVDDVTLDLMGFTLRGGTGDGISSTSVNNIEVRNGVVSSWAGSGVALSSTNSRIEGIRSYDNGVYGIRAGATSAVIDCVANDNNDSGISTGANCVVSGCSATSNGSGIQCSHGATIENSTSASNLGVGIHCQNCTINACVSRSNDYHGIDCSQCVVSDSNALGNSASGIAASYDATVTRCEAYKNGYDGIVVIDASHVLQSTATVNGQAGVGTGAGIHVTGELNRIEGNHLVGNDWGVLVDADMDNNLIIKNSALANTTDYSVPSGNDVGPIGFAATSTSPWANIH